MVRVVISNSVLAIQMLIEQFSALNKAKAFGTLMIVSFASQPSLTGSRALY